VYCPPGSSSGGTAKDVVVWQTGTAPAAGPVARPTRGLATCGRR
jgi:hypothetical protein